MLHDLGLGSFDAEGENLSAVQLFDELQTLCNRFDGRQGDEAPKFLTTERKLGAMAARRGSPAGSNASDWLSFEPDGRRRPTRNAGSCKRAGEVGIRRGQERRNR